MNCTNALGFLVAGLVLLLAPAAAPTLFPHTAIDGSSTRALWIEVMGWAQIGVATLYCLTQYVRGHRPALAAYDRPAAVAYTATERTEVLVVERVRTPEPEGSVVLHGSHAELWCAVNQALRHDGHARQLAARLVELAQAAAAGLESTPANVIAFDGVETADRDAAGAEKVA
jgi:hypothetical protein